MPARVDAIEKYVQGKKYQQVMKKQLDFEVLDKFKDFLTPSTKKNHEYDPLAIQPICISCVDRRQLFCKLTSRHLNKDPHHMLKHLEGKKFKRAYAKCK